jgi:hypothetical protein
MLPVWWKSGHLSRYSDGVTGWATEGFGFNFRQGQKILFSPEIPDTLGHTQPPVHCVPAVKRAERDAYHSSLWRADCYHRPDWRWKIRLTLRLAVSPSVRLDVDSVLGVIFRFSLSLYFFLYSYSEEVEEVSRAGIRGGLSRWHEPWAEVVTS